MIYARVRARARIRPVSRILKLMDHYLLSGLFGLVIALWTIVAVKYESGYLAAENRPVEDETETESQDVDNER